MAGPREKSLEQVRQRQVSDALIADLERRLGRVHARQRLGIERDAEKRVFGGGGLNFFHLENWYSLHSLIRGVLKASGFYWRGRRNAARLTIRRNTISIDRLPPAFDGFTILQISDLHGEENADALARAADLARDLSYDVCVLTGDYRFRTYGATGGAMRSMIGLCQAIHAPIYGVLGNHDSIGMLGELEDMGVHMLINEATAIERDSHRIYLGGIDDAHYFRVDNIEKTADAIPDDAVSILLSHTPEVYRQAAHAGFAVMLSGHTHGGQICLPGGFAPKLNAGVPRYMGAGAWRYGMLAGYTSTGLGTSVVPVRFNCPAEITLHVLERGKSSDEPDDEDRPAPVPAD